MQFEYDPERLIEEIKKRPAIWDFNVPEYRAKSVRCKVWNEIVKELMPPDVKMTKGEIRELEMQLQKKWKGIRDCFQKYMINPNRTKRPYIYLKQLQFLIKDQEPKDTDDIDNASSESDEKPRRVWKSKKKLKITKDETSDEDNNDYVSLGDSRESTYMGAEIIQPVKIAKLNKSQADEFVFANVDAQAKSDADDTDKMFLLSLLPHLKSIPEEFRLNVKLELMQVLQNANYSTAQIHKIL